VSPPGATCFRLATAAEAKNAAMAHAAAGLKLCAITESGRPEFVLIIPQVQDAAGGDYGSMPASLLAFSTISFSVFRSSIVLSCSVGSLRERILPSMRW